MIAKERKELYEKLLRSLSKKNFSFEVFTGKIEDRMVLRFRGAFMKHFLDEIQEKINPDTFDIYIKGDKLGMTIYNFKEGKKRLKKRFNNRKEV